MTERTRRRKNRERVKHRPYARCECGERARKRIIPNWETAPYRDILVLECWSCGKRTELPRLGGEIGRRIPGG